VAFVIAARIISGRVVQIANWRGLRGPQKKKRTPPATSEVRYPEKARASWLRPFGLGWPLLVEGDYDFFVSALMAVGGLQLLL
jgi:hypothetical protein